MITKYGAPQEATSEKLIWHNAGPFGQAIDVTPIETTAVDKLRVKGARELAAIVPLDGEQFGKPISRR